jgi:hypothetical protein
MEKLRQIRKFTTEQKYESFVANFAQEIIRNTNKTWENGYISIQELPTRHFDEDIQVRRTDIIVYVRINKKVVLIIECKVEEEDFEQGEVQLETYMIETRCSRGILMNSRIARLYIHNVNGKNRPYQIGSNIVLERDNELESLIEFINQAE